jgi:plastocyanin
MRAPLHPRHTTKKGDIVNNKTTVRVIIIATMLVGFGAIAFASISNNSMNNTAVTDNHSSNDGPKAGENTPQTSQAPVETNQITYKSFAVSPESITVKKGTTVTWTNEDSAKHDVVPEMETDEFKASKLFGKGETYSVTFNTVGSFSYYCSPHPYMKGTIEVTE